MNDALSRPSPGRFAAGTPEVSMLATRLVTGTLLVAALVAVLVLDEQFAPWYPFWLLTAIAVMGLSALEINALLGETSAKPSGTTVFGGVLALVVANWAPHVVEHLQQPLRLVEPAYEPLAPISWLAWPLWAFVAIVMLAFIAQSAQFYSPGGTMATISGTVLATAYIGVLGSFLVQMRWLGAGSTGIVPLAALIATAKGADTGAYTMGRLAGRHKLWPRLSPSKTIEGALGGMLAGVLAALVVFGVARLLFHVPSLSWVAAIGYGVVVGSAAQLGDLMESMIKRDCGWKDASTAVPGFGGVLDVMDSLLFAGPVAYGYWLLMQS